jgi:hypothetical protein
VLATVLGLAASACSPTTSPTQVDEGSATPTPAPTAPSAEDPETPAGDWSDILQRIEPDGDVDLDTALAAFSHAVGPLPGVAETSGEPDPFSGNDAVRWIIHHWGELTPEQQAAADVYLTPPNLDGPEETAFAPGVGLLAMAAPVAQPELRDGDRVCFQDQGMTGLMNVVRSEIEARVTNWAPTVAPQVPIFVCIVHESISKTSRIAPLNSERDYVDGPIESCLILLPGEAFLQMGTQLKELLAFHVFSCLIADIKHTIAAYSALPAWVASGASRWVAAELAEGPPIFDVSWPNWMALPERSLLARSTDAIGFFALMHARGEDSWSKVGDLPAWDRPYVLAVRSHRTLDGWGPGYFQNKLFGDPWYYGGAGLAWDRPVESALRIEAIDNGTTLTLGAEPYAASATTLTLNADIIVFSSQPGSRGVEWRGTANYSFVDGLGLEQAATAELTFTLEDALEAVTDPDKPEPRSPHGRMRLPHGEDLSVGELGNVAFCLWALSCEPCPAQSPGAVRQAKPSQVGIATIGLAGHTTGTDITITGMTRDEFCGTDPGSTDDRYVLTRMDWKWLTDGGLADNGCLWPPAKAEGSLDEPDWWSYIVIDTASHPSRYQGFASHSAASGDVIVPECVVGGVRKYKGGAHQYNAGSIWIDTIAIADGPWFDFDGGIISGSSGWDRSTSTWILTSFAHTDLSDDPEDLTTGGG